MNQILDTQLALVTPINKYRWQQNLNQSESDRVSAKHSRNRGLFLSHQGWQKLMQVGVLCTEFGERYTYEQLSERSQLDARTISRLLSCEIKVDKNTIRTFFRAFNVSLEAGDFTAIKSDKTNGITSNPPASATVTIQRDEFEQIIEELAQLKQSLREYDRLFQRLGLSETYIGHQLGA